MYTRDECVSLIKNFVLDFDLIETAWEGGSTATGYLDEYSDLDLYLVTEPENKEEVLVNLVKFLEDTLGKMQMYRLPEPTWHGFSQVFFNPAKSPELFYIDFVVIGKDIEDKLTESNRHGIAQLWKENYKIDTSPRSDDKIQEVANSIINRTTTMDFVLIIELKKALHRGIFLEAFPLYMSFISRLLVPMMSIIYRPEKADFGLRYIYRDYPNEEYKLIEDALRVSTIEEMKKYSTKLLVLYDEIKTKLKK